MSKTLDQTTIEGPEKAAYAAPTSKRRALWSGGVYTVASAAPRVIGFLLLPIYTRVLSPSDYGQLSVALSTSQVAIIIFALGLDVAVFRNLFHLADDPPARNRFVGSIWTFLLVTPIAMALVLEGVLGPILSESHILSADRLALSLLSAAIFVSATTVPLAALRAEDRLRDYVLVNAVATLTTTLLTLTLVVWADAGVSGWLLAAVIGNLLTLIATARVMPYARPKPFDRAMVRDALRLSLPVVPHLAAMLSLLLADRVLVAAMLSTTAAGLYGLASNMALPMMMIVVGFGQAFMPAYAHAGKAGNRDEALPATISLQVGLICVLCAACALLAAPAVHILASPQYAPAAELTPWIVLGFGFWGLYQVPMHAITLTYGRTRGLVLISGTGAVVNIGLIVALAPRYGLELVAIASAAGYATLLLCVYLFARVKGAVLPYPWREMALIVALTLCGYAGGALTSGATTALDVVIRLGWATAIAIGVGAILVDRGDLQVLYGKAFSKRGIFLPSPRFGPLRRRAEHLVRRQDDEV